MTVLLLQKKICNSDIVRDAKILEMARNEAIDFVKSNKIEDFPMLKEITSLTLFSGLDI